MASSSAGGAAEHALPAEWCGGIAFSNIGLAGAAVLGQQWHKVHRPRLRRLLTELLRENVMGIGLNEVGNMSDLLTEPAKQRVEQVVAGAFSDVGALEHGPPRIFWSGGETMAMFRADVQVEALPSLTNMLKVDDWRTVDRFVLTGATVET